MKFTRTRPGLRPASKGVFATRTLRSPAVVVAAGLCVLAAAFSVGPSPSSSAAGGPEEGRRLFLQACAACHGRDARGIPNLGKDLVAGAFARRLPDDALATFIERGRPADDPLNTTGIPMPPKGGNPALTRADVEDIVAYLRTLQAE